MKIIKFLEVLVITLTLTVFISNLNVYASPLSGTSHEAPVTGNTGDENEEPEPPASSKIEPSKSSSSKKPSSSKSSSSSKESSSKAPSSSKESNPSSSKKNVSNKTETSSPSSNASSRNQSSNSYLFSLRVVNRKDESILYSLMPAFSKDTLTYSVSVPAEVTGVALYGTPEDSANARVQYNNRKVLVEGEINRLSVVCIAGNGERRTYVINVSRGTVASSGDSSIASSSEAGSSEISLPPVVIGNISSNISLTSVENKEPNSLLLGIFAWVFLLGGLAIVILVILNSSSLKKSIGSSTVGAYTPNTRQNRMKKPRRKAKRRLLDSSYYSKYSRYKH